LRNFIRFITESVFIMRKSKNHRLGVFSGLFLVLALGIALPSTGFGQGIKDLQKVTKEVVSPLKDVQKATNTVSKDIKDVTTAPKTVANEVKRTEQGFEKLGDQVDKAIPDAGKKGDDGKTSQEDSLSGKGNAKAAEEGSGVQRKTAIPDDYVPGKSEAPTAVVTDPKNTPRPVPFGSKDNKTPSGPMPKSDLGKNGLATGGTESGALPVNNDPQTDNDPNKSGGRYVNLDPTAQNGQKRPKADYSNSPARLPLEKADYDVETLEELFQFSNWEGPEREHTVRAVSAALDDLQLMISEIKKLDPGHSTWRLEEKYKDMRAAYFKETKGQ
jgi:hypothetical protein